MSRCRSRLVDLLVAPSGVARANLYRGAGVFEAEVVCLRAVLDNAYLVLGVAGVGHSLNTRTLVGVVARTREASCAESLPSVGSLAITGLVFALSMAIEFLSQPGLSKAG